MSWKRTLPVLLVVAGIGAAVGLILREFVSPKILGLLCSLASIACSFANTYANNWQRKLDDLANLPWPDPVVRDNLRLESKRTRSLVIFRIRLLFATLITGFFSGVITTSAVTLNVIKISSALGFAALFISLYLWMRMFQGAHRTVEQVNELLALKDKHEKNEAFIKQINTALVTDKAKTLA